MNAHRRCRARIDKRGRARPLPFARMDRLALLADPAVRSAFGGELGRLIEYHPSIGSTQDRARELAGFDRAPTLIVADQQTGGHGRGEKSWLSEAGGSLLASWTFR